MSILYLFILCLCLLALVFLLLKCGFRKKSKKTKKIGLSRERLIRANLACSDPQIRDGQLNVLTYENIKQSQRTNRVVGYTGIILALASVGQFIVLFNNNASNWSKLGPFSQLATVAIIVFLFLASCRLLTSIDYLRKDYKD